METIVTLLQKPLLVYNKVLMDFVMYKSKMSWPQVQDKKTRGQGSEGSRVQDKKKQGFKDSRGPGFKIKKNKGPRVQRP
jgi:hypothetical protein